MTRLEIWHYPRAAVLAVIDGDTVDLRIDLGFHAAVKLRFRLTGLDAPERNSPDATVRERAMLATARLRELLPLGSLVSATTEKDRTEKYGRFLARVIMPDGRCVNDLMIAEGLAVPYLGGSR